MNEVINRDVLLKNIKSIFEKYHIRVGESLTLANFEVNWYPKFTANELNQILEDLISNKYISKNNSNEFILNKDLGLW
jgi:hypothetical protein